MTLGKRAVAILGAYVATVALLIPLILSLVYLLSRLLPPNAPKVIVYVALGLCIMIGVGLLRWFRIRIEGRLG